MIGEEAARELIRKLETSARQVDETAIGELSSVVTVRMTASTAWRIAVFLRTVVSTAEEGTE